MDLTKILPILIILGGFGYFAYDKHQKEAAGSVSSSGGVSTGPTLACADVEKEYGQIGSALPTEEQRVRHECRLHVCGMSFMHDHNLQFPRGEEDALVVSGAEKSLTGKFSTVDAGATKEYDFNCSVLSADIRPSGPIPIRSASVIPKAAN